MAKRHTKEHAKSIVDEVVTHGQKVRRGEEGIGAFLHAVWNSIRKFFYRLTKPPASENRKKAIHKVKKGMAAYNASALRDAEEYFKEAIKLDPGYARAHAYLGNTLSRRGQMSAAMLAWDQAVKAEPKSDAASMARDRLETMRRNPKPWEKVL